MLERDIEIKVKEYARNRGWLAYKFTSPGHAFVPDCILVSPIGRVIFVEFRQTGKKGTPGQIREIKRLIDHNVFACVVDSVEKGKDLVDAHMEAVC